ALAKKSRRPAPPLSFGANQRRKNISLRPICSAARNDSATNRARAEFRHKFFLARAVSSARRRLHRGESAVAARTLRMAHDAGEAEPLRFPRAGFTAGGCGRSRHG